MHHWRRLSLVVFCLCLASSGSHAGELSIQTIETQHRPAEQLVPIIKPLIQPPGGVSAFGTRLILRASAAEMSAVMSLLRQLDKAPQNLTVEVRHISGVETEDSRYGITRPGDRRHGQRAGAHIRRYNSRETPELIQRLRVLDGEVARISTGTTRPLVLTHYPDPSYHQGRTADSVVFVDATDALYVRPQLTGERVFLDISPQRADFVSRYDVKTQRAVSRITARLGQWVEVASSGSATHQRRSGVGTDSIYRTNARTDESYRVLVRIRLATTH